MSSIEIEVYEAQNKIISIQTEVINDLFILLTQHIEAEELDNLPVIEKINEAARIKAEHEL